MQVTTSPRHFSETNELADAMKRASLVVRAIQFLATQIAPHIPKKRLLQENLRKISKSDEMPYAIMRSVSLKTDAETARTEYEMISNNSIQLIVEMAQSLLKHAKVPDDFPKLLAKRLGLLTSTQTAAIEEVMEKIFGTFKYPVKENEISRFGSILRLSSSGNF